MRTLVSSLSLDNTPENENATEGAVGVVGSQLELMHASELLPGLGTLVVCAASADVTCVRRVLLGGVDPPFRPMLTPPVVRVHHPRDTQKLDRELLSSATGGGGSYVTGSDTSGGRRDAFGPAAAAPAVPAGPPCDAETGTGRLPAAAAAAPGG
jgi:hypothetical protein